MPFWLRMFQTALVLRAEVGDRPDAAVDRVRLGEAVDAVLMGALAGGDRGPQHGRERRVEGGEVPGDAAIHHALQVRHLAGVQQRVDQFPVGCVPADEQHLAGNRWLSA